MVEAALDAGSQDNATALVLDVLALPAADRSVMIRSTSTGIGAAPSSKRKLSFWKSVQFATLAKTSEFTPRTKSIAVPATSPRSRPTAVFSFTMRARISRAATTSRSPVCSRAWG